VGGGFFTGENLGPSTTATRRKQQVERLLPFWQSKSKEIEHVQFSVTPTSRMLQVEHGGNKLTL